MDQKISRLFYLAEALFPAFEVAHRDILGGRKGIYLAIHKITEKDNSVIAGRIIGELHESKNWEKQQFAEEKIRRMMQNDEIASFQSENPDEQQYGGGIRATNYFVASSNLLPHLEQKFAIMLCIMAEELRVSEYEDIKNKTLININTWRKQNGEKVLSLSEL